MKLRIRGNSVRIRVSQGEFARIVETGAAEDAVRFSPTAVLRYRVEVAQDGGSPRADLAGNLVRITLPRRRVERWLTDDEVSIRGEQPIGEGRTLKILVEKDFACLAPRNDDEEEGDSFPNPRATASGR
jgi:hypothetical protein